MKSKPVTKKFQAETLRERIARAGGGDIGEPRPECFLHADPTKRGGRLHVAEGVPPCLNQPVLAVSFEAADGSMSLTNTICPNN